MVPSVPEQAANAIEAREEPAVAVGEQAPHPVEALVVSSEKAKKKKKKRKKKSDERVSRDRGCGDCGSEEDSDESGKCPLAGEGTGTTRPRESEKRGKKKKNEKKKRGRDDVSSIRDDSSGAGKCPKKKHRKKRSRGKEKRRSPKEMDDGVVSSSAIEYYPQDLKDFQAKKNRDGEVPGHDVGATRDGDAGDNFRTAASSARAEDAVTLLLFYQYIEPPWDEGQFRTALRFAEGRGRDFGLTGRMRVAREGLNCTLTGSPAGMRGWIAAMRGYDGGRARVDPATGRRRTEFADTEFKLTDDLPPRQRFPKLHAFEVVELVNYGLAGRRVPEILTHGGTHLEPGEYHRKMREPDAVVIDVRNHYEANIGRFDPPEGGARVIDPMMRKSTEFPMWLDKKETKDMLRGKQVLMYCTGGVRCERASALLKQKMETEEDTKDLGIKGVYQLQGGIDKYFKQFPEGGMWRGKNYVFDKRFAHAPPAVEAAERKRRALGGDAEEAEGTEKEGGSTPSGAMEMMGKCEACQKPWDMYRGKRRCPTCGVPSLICRDCFMADKAGTRKLGRDVRCDLCVAEGVRNKRELGERERRETEEYERRMRRRMGDGYERPTQRKHAATRKPRPNPGGVTRLFLGNMCARRMDESALLEFLRPAEVTHIQWLTDRNTGRFYGSAFIEVKTANDAGLVLAVDGMLVLGRNIKVKYQKADEKDLWPVPNTEISTSVE